MRLKFLFVVICLFAAQVRASEATLDLYGELSGKTILAPSALPALPDSIVAELPPERTDAIALIESEFSTRGISVVQDGPRFVRLLPTGRRQAYLTDAPLRGAQLGTSARQEVLPAGTVNFPRTELNQVLRIYADLKKRTILRTRFLPQPPIHPVGNVVHADDELPFAQNGVPPQN